MSNISSSITEPAVFSTARASSVGAAINPPNRVVIPPGGNFGPVSEYFGSLTFGLRQMREKLPREAYQNLIKTLEQGKKLPKETAEAIASSVKEWAVSKGVTHFCHWFQPLTGLTAEKHDAFISIQTNYHSELTVIERFTGSQLIQGELDQHLKLVAIQLGILLLRSLLSKMTLERLCAYPQYFLDIMDKRLTVKLPSCDRLKLSTNLLASF
jgi:hypothetical protein